jgi:putative endonuclease
MRQKTQTDRTRPTLCHAAVRAPEPARGTPVAAVGGAAADNFSGYGRSNDVGAAFEARALEFLRRQRLRFVARNVLCRGGELDLVMRESDGTLVFVEVRARSRRGYGGAASSIGWQKRRKIVHAAQYYLMTRTAGTAACRFDVVAFEAGRLVWLRDAFRADEV